MTLIAAFIVETQLPVEDNIFYSYTVSQTNQMHTLLYTIMFKLHSYIFRTNESVHLHGESQFHKSHTIQQYGSKILFQQGKACNLDIKCGFKVCTHALHLICPRFFTDVYLCFPQFIQEVGKFFHLVSQSFCPMTYAIKTLLNVVCVHFLSTYHYEL
jgi:hypothetical protein